MHSACETKKFDELKKIINIHKIHQSSSIIKLEFSEQRQSPEQLLLVEPE